MLVYIKGPHKKPRIYYPHLIIPFSPPVVFLTAVVSDSQNCIKKYTRHGKIDTWFKSKIHGCLVVVGLFSSSVGRDLRKSAKRLIEKNIILLDSSLDVFFVKSSCGDLVWSCTEQMDSIIHSYIGHYHILYFQKKNISEVFSRAKKKKAKASVGIIFPWRVQFIYKTPVF